jgi:hypothetical protein
VAHSFLLESGSWNVDGYWLKPGLAPIPIQGNILISWKQKNWFKMTTLLTYGEEAAAEILCKCRGNLDYEENYYTYVSQHSLLGNIEGEGRIGFQSIVQYYWFMGTNVGQKGFDTFYCLNQNTYHFTSSILDSHNLKNTIEATIKR